MQGPIGSIGGPAEFGLTLHGHVARYPQGRQSIGDALFAYLQPNGALGESNAGLVVGEGESLLVDTLWDLPSTAQMLACFADITDKSPITKVVNTHSDGDHCWGNQLLVGAEILSTVETARQMPVEKPAVLRALATMGRLGAPLSRQRLALGPIRTALSFARLAGEFAPFDFQGIRITLPTRTFSGSMQVEIGGRQVQLIHVGPAHTEGDTIVNVPDSRTVFAGDVLFLGTTPIIWAGTAASWIKALDRILELDPEVVVPGHGPITDVEGVMQVRRYWELIEQGVSRALVKGAGAVETSREIVGSQQYKDGGFDAWDGPERTATNVYLEMRSAKGVPGRPGQVAWAKSFIAMAELAGSLHEGRNL